ncbi:DUF1684 domain-containing protein [Rudanella lutea]|uniref:DUF1684 domain-containing protein n=1 Tax=Rudanella lutea TaxID=451374 RepID=UPI0009FE999B|nr:DUF1684 domain-containing protein [Rudanella lutea]
MKFPTVLRLSVIAVFAAIAYFLLKPILFNGDNSSTGGAVNVAEWEKELTNSRKNKDEFFRTDKESPLEDKASFNGLIYFPGNIEYRVEARFEPFADKTQRIVISLSDGSEEVYEQSGHAVFKLRGEVCRLLIVKQGDTYSILFKDATSGKTTYGGGRYIDLKESAFQGNNVTIDFNTAYHPYCVYNHTYACPLPPAENTLPVAVEVGEKLPAQYNK